MKFKGAFTHPVLCGLCVMLLAIACTDATTTEAPPTTPMMTEILTVTAEITMITETTVVDAPTEVDPAAPLVPDATVSVLSEPVDRTGCGTDKACAAEPEDCDPSVSNDCFHVGAKQTSGQNYEFELAGETDGYIAVSLTQNSNLGEGDTTYACANANGNPRFLGGRITNGVPEVTQLPVNNVRASINGRKVLCKFSATVPDSDTRAARFGLAVSTGTYDPTNNRLGAPQAKLQTPVVDISNPNSTTTNTLNANTTTPSPSTTATTGHAPMLQQSLATALLLTVGVMTLCIL